MGKLLELFFCHLLGDYVLQTSFIANGKGKNWWHLVVHCMLYIFPFYLFFSSCWQMYVLLFAHFMIDAAKSRFNVINYKIDQMLHIALLLLYCL